MTVSGQNRGQDDLHVELAIYLHCLCDNSLPTLGFTNINLDEDSFTTLLRNPFMGRDFLALTKGFEVSTNKKSTFYKKLITDFPANSLGRACDYRDATLQTLARHDRIVMAE